MLPQDAVGGCKPKPRNESVDSVRITPGIDSEAATMMGPSAFGSSSLKMIDGAEAPIARAASVYSLARSTRNSPRTRRATFIHEITEMTSAIDVMVGRMEVNAAMRNSSGGKAK